MKKWCLKTLTRTKFANTDALENYATPLMSRHWATAGLDVGLRACVLPTGKLPPLTPLRNTSTS